MCFYSFYVLACGHASRIKTANTIVCEEVERGEPCEGMEMRVLKEHDIICMDCREEEDKALFLGNGVQKYPDAEETEYVEVPETG